MKKIKIMIASVMMLLPLHAYESSASSPEFGKNQKGEWRYKQSWKSKPVGQYTAFSQLLCEDSEGSKINIIQLLVNPSTAKFSNAFENSENKTPSDPIAIMQRSGVALAFRLFESPVKSPGEQQTFKNTEALKSLFEADLQKRREKFKEEQEESPEGNFFGVHLQPALYTLKTIKNQVSITFWENQDHYINELLCLIQKEFQTYPIELQNKLINDFKEVINSAKKN